MGVFVCFTSFLVKVCWVLFRGRSLGDVLWGCRDFVNLSARWVSVQGGLFWGVCQIVGVFRGEVGGTYTVLGRLNTSTLLLLGRDGVRCFYKFSPDRNTVLVFGGNRKTRVISSQCARTTRGRTGRAKLQICRVASGFASAIGRLYSGTNIGTVTFRSRAVALGTCNTCGTTANYSFVRVNGELVGVEGIGSRGRLRCVMGTGTVTRGDLRRLRGRVGPNGARGRLRTFFSCLVLRGNSSNISFSAVLLANTRASLPRNITDSGVVRGNSFILVSFKTACVNCRSSVAHAFTMNATARRVGRTCRLILHTRLTKVGTLTPNRGYTGICGTTCGILRRGRVNGCFERSLKRNINLSVRRKCGTSPEDASIFRTNGMASVRPNVCLPGGFKVEVRSIYIIARGKGGGVSRFPGRFAILWSRGVLGRGAQVGV